MHIAKETGELHMTHGFITIATGDEQYYSMAANLVRSYRLFSAAPLPFAILSDRENAFTAEFDDVRIFPQVHRNYLDKLEMFDLLPYDVNIFIDADCLAYGELNELFEVFADADDFSCFGRVLPLDDRTGWFEYDQLGELQSQVSYVVGLHGGIYYMRKTELCRAVLQTAQELVPHYAEYGFKGNFATPGDEPLVALSMALHQCRPIPHDLTRILCYWEHQGQMKLNLPAGVALARDIGVQTTLLHWGTRFTKTPLYRKQVADMSTFARGGGTSVAYFVHNLRYGCESAVQYTAHFVKRCWRKLLRILHCR